MSKLEELWQEYKRKSEEHEKVRLARMEFESGLMTAIRRQVQEKFGAEEAEADRAERDAGNAFHAEENRLRIEETATKLPHPEGAVLCEWASPWRYGNIGQKEMKPTGRKAILQIYRPGDLLPGNVRYCGPVPGRIVLRFLKKDGTPGAAVQMVGRRNLFAENGESTVRWLPEGKEPKLI